MTNDEQFEALERQVFEILEEVGWAAIPAPNEGRVEVITFRASLKAFTAVSAPDKLDPWPTFDSPRAAICDEADAPIPRWSDRQPCPGGWADSPLPPGRHLDEPFDPDRRSNPSRA
jgi:hypothetical protein